MAGPRWIFPSPIVTVMSSSNILLPQTRIPGHGRSGTVAEVIESIVLAARISPETTGTTQSRNYLVIHYVPPLHTHLSFYNLLEYSNILAVIILGIQLQIAVSLVLCWLVWLIPS